MLTVPSDQRELLDFSLKLIEQCRISVSSRLAYYRLLNAMVLERMGPAHSANIVLVSLNQFDFTSRAAQPSPEHIVAFLKDQIQGLKAAGADFFSLCANGAHRFAPALLPHIDLPFVSIIDATAQRVAESGLRQVGLLGVKQTMSGRFYHERLAQAGVGVITPDETDQDVLHAIIYDELVHNRITEQSRRVVAAIMAKMADAGAQGVILGCTELPLLIQQDPHGSPLFDTMQIHCDAILAHAFS